jgi:hypothetical protein
MTESRTDEQFSPDEHQTRQGDPQGVLHGADRTMLIPRVLRTRTQRPVKHNDIECLET